jgi:hypothetical protein
MKYDLLLVGGEVLDPATQRSAPPAGHDSARVPREHPVQFRKATRMP